MKIYCIDKKGTRLFKKLIDHFNLSFEGNILIPIFPYFWSDIEEWNFYYSRFSNIADHVFHFEDLVARQQHIFQNVDPWTLYSFVKTYTLDKQDGVIHYSNYNNALNLQGNPNIELMKSFKYPILDVNQKYFCDLLNNLHKKIFNTNISYEHNEHYLKYLKSGSSPHVIEKIWIRHAPSFQWVNVFMCSRDNEDTIHDTFHHFTLMETMYPWRWRFFIYENDSTDSTPILIQNFMNDKNGKYVTTTHDTFLFGHVQNFERVKNMSMYRNNCKDLCTDWQDSPYSLLIDTNISFPITLFEYLLYEMKKIENCVMISPFAATKKGIYYDTYAFQTITNDNTYPTNVYEPFEVKSAFGGFVIIKTDILKKCRWKPLDKNHSEHNGLCEQVRKYGKIYVCHPSDQRTIWTE
tara:strand:- start:1414 stop:2634 length:1221 start_codon:yes stop_codon:yes gene_type:complete